jgi:hypothetical protein
MNSAINATQQTPPLWERLSNESAKAFAAFCVYRDLPPSRRSLDEAGRLIHGTQEGRKRGATGRLREWAKAHHWASRVAAWDAHCDRASCQARVDAAREMQQKHQAILAGVCDKIADSLVRSVAWDSLTPTQAMKVLSDLIGGLIPNMIFLPVPRRIWSGARHCQVVLFKDLFIRERPHEDYREGTGSRLAPQHRRGHWKRVAHGEKFSLRKWMWI